MAGVFQKIGEMNFPGSKVGPKCTVYEWGRRDQKLYGNFTIRFISPNEPGARVYYVLPLLQSWMGGPSNQFLDKACRCGSKILAKLERHSHDDRDLYRLAHALFRNRREGRNWVGNRFQFAIDFIDLPSDGPPSIIVPGLGSDESSVVISKNATAHQKARRLLADALNQPKSARRGGRAWLADVLDLFNLPKSNNVKLSAEGEEGAQDQFVLALEKLPWRSDLDLLFTDGIKRSSADWDWPSVVAKVRSSLIYDPQSATNGLELQRGSRNWELSKKFIARLRAEVNSQSPTGFDRWLARAREHRFLSLIGTTRLKGKARDETAGLGQRLYRDLLWTSYTLMARCWGALMLVVYIDFWRHGQQESREPDREIARWRFRQMHFPQAFFAGLPLDFLEKPRLRWVVPCLQKLWGDIDLETEHYDAVTDRLGLLGDLVNERRNADRKRKAANHETERTSPDVSEVPDKATMKPADYLLELEEERLQQEEA